mmetsp:Transcript_22087/g.52286  ORF Transcript_22087/g.52286 Transcript_22087/m.52286 type:complete len:83 (-) Transcript_22087:326-574(-)
MYYPPKGHKTVKFNYSSTYVIQSILHKSTSSLSILLHTHARASFFTCFATHFVCTNNIPPHEMLTAISKTASKPLGTRRKAM